MEQTYAARVAAGETDTVARELGLHRIGARPRLVDYVKSIWERRPFLWTLATANAYGRNRDNYLGQLWNILNPLLWSAVYGLVFGLLLNGRRGMTGEEYIPFLVAGVFTFRYLSACMTSGAKAIQGNISLVRSLHFPRAVLPIASALTEFVLFLPGLLVMGTIIVAFNQGPIWTWLLYPAVLLMVGLFSIGLSLIIARLVVEVRDVANLLPFVTRLLLYTSGVFFALDRFADEFDRLGVPWLQTVASYQPFALFLDLTRATLTDFRDVPSLYWPLGVGYAILFLVGGFMFFWRAEERYGRD